MSCRIPLVHPQAPPAVRLADRFESGLMRPRFLLVCPYHPQRRSIIGQSSNVGTARFSVFRGQRVQGRVLRIQAKERRLALTLRRLQPDDSEGQDTS